MNSSVQKNLPCEILVKEKEDFRFVLHEQNKQTKRSGNAPKMSTDTRNLAALAVLRILVPRWRFHAPKTQKA
jgi:hypothetical protein